MFNNVSLRRLTFESIERDLGAILQLKFLINFLIFGASALL